MINEKEILNFCKTHGYYVEVERTRGHNGCVAKYPPRTAVAPTSYPYERTYMIKDTGISYRGQEDDHHVFVKCPSYSSRILIFNDILMKCLELRITKSVISWNTFKQDEKIEVSCFDEVFDPPDLKKDKELEHCFSSIFLRHFCNPFNDYTQEAERLGVLEGYDLIRHNKNSE